MLHLHGDVKDSPYFTVDMGALSFDLVIDNNNNIVTPQRSELIKDGFEGSDALNLALENLKLVSNDSGWRELQPHIWVSDYRDDYDAARLVSLFPDCKLPFDGNPIVFMPSHSICLITDNPKADVLQAMIAYGEQEAQEHRPLSQTIWHYEKGGWQPLTLLQDHDAAQIAKTQHYKDVANGYGEQKSLLEAKFEKAEQDIFVASQLLCSNDDMGGIFSLSVMTFGVDSLLPQSDQVGCVDPELPKYDQYLGMMPWDDFLSLMMPEGLKLYGDLYPVRYDALSGLSAAQRDRIRQYFKEKPAQ